MAKYKVGQVVRIDVDYYKNSTHKGEAYQQIIHMEPWSYSKRVETGNTKAMCLTFANGDRCHEKWVKPLTKREAGR